MQTVLWGSSMSVSITIEHAVKRYGANAVIPDLSLKINNGGFIN